MLYSTIYNMDNLMHYLMCNACIMPFNLRAEFQCKRNKKNFMSCGNKLVKLADGEQYPTKRFHNSSIKM